MKKRFNSALLLSFSFLTSKTNKIVKWTEFEFPGFPWVTKKANNKVNKGTDCLLGRKKYLYETIEPKITRIKVHLTEESLLRVYSIGSFDAPWIRVILD